MSTTGSENSGLPPEFDEVVEQLKESLARHSGDVTPVADLAQVLVLAAEQRHGRHVRWAVSAVALLIAIALAGFFAGTGGSNSDVHVASAPVSSVSTAPTMQRATTTTVAATTTVAPTTAAPTTVAPTTAAPPATVPQVTTPNVQAPSGTVPPTSGPTCSPNAPNPATAVGQFYAAVNGARAANGEGPLCWNGSLASTAQTWSQQMSGPNGLNHTPDLASECAGVSGWTSCTQAIGDKSPSVSVLMNKFMNDPPHRAIILGQSGPANMVGIGVVVEANGDIWVTMNFAFA